jgi:hypothetical protein
MRKKILLILMLFLVGCSNQITTVNKANGDSKTYLFFKDFDVKKYYVCFFDRNNAKNDNTKIIMARDNDKYYYEINGSNNRIIIQKNGIRYEIDPKMMNYFQSNKVVTDFSDGFLPKDILALKTAGYKYGTEKVFNSTYYFERYTVDKNTTTYYYSGNELIYVRYKTVSKDALLKFNYMSKKVNSSLFEIDKDYQEITY